MVYESFYEVFYELVESIVVERALISESLSGLTTSSSTTTTAGVKTLDSERLLIEFQDPQGSYSLSSFSLLDIIVFFFLNLTFVTIVIFFGSVVSNSIVMFLRLLTSAELRRNKEEYFAFLLSEDGDVVDVPTFCSAQVDPCGKEAGQFLCCFFSAPGGLSLNEPNRPRTNPSSRPRPQNQSRRGLSRRSTTFFFFFA